MERLSDNVYVHTVSTHGFNVSCAVVVATGRVFVFDTLDSPQAMQPVRDLVDDLRGDRRVTVVNSHHHWDHVYGNAAFAGCDIIANQLCPHLMTASLPGGADASVSAPPPPPEGVPLPTIGFGDRMHFDDPAGAVHLIRTPGHTADSIIMYLDEHNILFGGDTIEWPFPTFGLRDCEQTYLRTLRLLNQLPVKQVVPSHGPVMGKEVIDLNQRYIEDVYEVVRTIKAGGNERTQLDLPVDEFAPPGVEIPASYLKFHRENLEWAFDDV
jgi:cyclase